MIKLSDIRKHAERRPGHVAVVDGEVRLTWANLADKVARVATAIEERLPGIRRARAVFVAENRWELVVAMAAVSSLGIPCVGLDYTAGPEATAGALEQLQPTVIISTSDQRAVLTEVGWPEGRDVLDIRLDSDPPKNAPASPSPTCCCRSRANRGRWSSRSRRSPSPPAPAASPSW